MSMEKNIHQKLSLCFEPLFLDITNESYMHSVPKGSESHFRVFIVSEKFKDLSRIQRQRAVYQCLEGELRNGIHALTLKTLTGEEYSQSPEWKASPQCLGHKQK